MPCGVIERWMRRLCLEWWSRRLCRSLPWAQKGLSLAASGVDVAGELVACWSGGGRVELVVLALVSSVGAGGAADVWLIGFS